VRQMLQQQQLASPSRYCPPLSTRAEDTELVLQATLHQGAIEAIFLDELKALGVTVDRPSIPQSLTFTDEAAIISDPSAHAVTVSAVQNVNPVFLC
jgi:hypothetical protein